MYFTINLLIHINNIITGSNYSFLRHVNVKPSGCNKMNLDKDLIKDKL